MLNEIKAKRLQLQLTNGQDKYCLTYGADITHEFIVGDVWFWLVVRWFC